MGTRISFADPRPNLYEGQKALLMVDVAVWNVSHGNAVVIIVMHRDWSLWLIAVVGGSAHGSRDWFRVWVVAEVENFGGLDISVTYRKLRAVTFLVTLFSPNHPRNAWCVI
jgi:hypothetical protein